MTSPATNTPEGGDPLVPITQPPGAVPQRTARSLGSAAVYSAGFTLQRAIGLLMLPVYTRALPPGEYGALGVLLSLAAGVGFLFSAGVETSLVRNYFQLASEPQHRQEYLASVWRFMVLYPVLGSLVLTAVAWPLTGSSQPVGGVEILLTLLASATNVAATTLPLAVLRARQDLRGFLWIVLVAAIATPALTVGFVVLLDQGIRGWFIASLIANVATFATATIAVPWRPRSPFRWPMVRATLMFSLPLIPHSLSHWALQLADRGVIAGMVSGEDLGAYTLAGTLASTVLLLVIALNQGFVPNYANAGTDPGQEERLSRVVVVQITAVVTLTLVGAMLGPRAVEILTPVSYHGAVPLVPWLVLGYGFLGLYFIPMNGATLAAGRTAYAWVATAVSAAANIGLLFLLVPEYGVYAAAVASAVAYFTLLALNAIWAHARPNPVRYDWAPIAQVITAGGLAYLGASLTASGPSVVESTIQIGWLLAFTVAVALLVFRSQLAARLG